MDLTRFHGHMLASKTKLLKRERAQQVYMSNPRTEIYNFWHLYQAAKLAA
jgi:hypothetical protein